MVMIFCILREKYIKIVNEVFPSNTWVLGVGKIYAAQIETELAKVETDENKKIAILKNAALDMENGVSTRMTSSSSPISIPSSRELVATIALSSPFFIRSSTSRRISLAIDP